jgi:acetyltransferase-like isoleucine patch superfamily enzyme
MKILWEKIIGIRFIMGENMTIEKFKFYCMVLSKINFINFIRFNLLKKFSGWILPYKRGYYTIHNKSKIIINNRGKFIFNNSKGNDPFMGHLMMEAGSKLIINGNFSIESGGRVSIGKNAVLELGSGYIAHNVFIVCKDKITIGNGATISHNVVIRDNDAHEIIDEGYVSVKPIEIGNHVWIGTNVTILKGVKIGNGAIVGANSLINKNIPEKTIVAGIPAKIIRENIEWE